MSPIFGQMPLLHAFCDESHIDTHQYRVQGGIWVPEEGMRVVRASLRALRSEYPNVGEFKWTYVGGQKPHVAYSEFVEMFFSGPASRFLSFKCIVIPRSADPSSALGKIGRDLGFYKAYYTFLLHRLEPGFDYHIRLDRKPSPRPEPEAELRQCLNSAGAREPIPWKVFSCRPVRSQTEDLVQMADVLCGALGWAWNGKKSEAAAKPILADQIRHALGWEKLEEKETYRHASKFNVWRYRPRTK